MVTQTHTNPTLLKPTLLKPTLLKPTLLKPDFKNYNMKTESWNFKKLTHIPPFQRNRDTEPRIKKMTQILKTFNPTQLNVHVGKAIIPFGKYNKGDMFLLDGNTRVATYKLFPELIPPIQFNVTIYEFDNIEDAINTYYSIDNTLTSEKSNEKITGLHRELNFKPISKIFKTGRYKSAVEIASDYSMDKNKLPLRNQSPEKKLEFFWDEIRYLDSMNYDLFQRASSNVTGCFLLIGKKYGILNERFILLVDNYKNGHTTMNNNKGVDGVHYVYYKLFEEFRAVWTVTGYSKTEIVTKILYCFDLFIQDKPIPKKFPTQKKLRTFLQNYLQ